MKSMRIKYLGNHCLAVSALLFGLFLIGMACSSPKAVQQNNPSEIENSICQWDVLEIPNAFTPNNDGINDVWKPIHLETVENLHVRVIGKYGELVFESKEKNFEWNGTDIKGREIEAGLYGFVINYQHNGTQQQCRGALTILR
jgi:gliding motility-associated-like protein